MNVANKRKIFTSTQVSNSAPLGWADVVRNATLPKPTVHCSTTGRIDVDVKPMNTDYKCEMIHCCDHHSGVCCIVPKLLSKLKKQQEIIDIMITGEVHLIETTNTLNKRIDAQQKQINDLIQQNHIIDECNNVCNVLDVIFNDIVADVNESVGSEYFTSWKHLRQHISRRCKNWRYYEVMLCNVLTSKYQTTLNQFDSDITGTFGIKGKRNSVFHPKINFMDMRKRAIDALSNGCLMNENFSATTLKLIHKQRNIN